MKKVGLFVICLFLALALGCTQGGDDETTIQITSTAALDGYIRGSTVRDNWPDYAITIGDLLDDVVMRGFVSFDLSAIGSTIKSAHLRLYQVRVKNDAYGDLGAIVVDHVFIGSTLDAADYAGGTITSNIGTLSSNATVEWKELDVTSAVQQDYAEGRDDSQFRLRFVVEGDNDGVDEFVTFEDGENNRSTGNQPTLVVSYEE